MKANPDRNSNFPNIPDGSDPREIPSQASTQVEVNAAERPRIGATLRTAANRNGVSMDDLVIGPKVEALVATEAGKEFTSTPLLKRVSRIAGKVLVAPES